MGLAKAMREMDSEFKLTTGQLVDLRRLIVDAYALQDFGQRSDEAFIEVQQVAAYVKGRLDDGVSVYAILDMAPVDLLREVRDRNDS